MKKTILTIGLLLTLISLTACSGSDKEKLYILNWGDYLDSSLIEKFESEYNVEIVYEEAPSNEDMYSKITLGTTPFDLVYPSEYMVDRLIQEDMLYPLNYEIIGETDQFFDKTLEVLREVDPENKYALPYAWGSLGLMYNLEVEDIVKERGFDVLFEEIDGIEKVGMYDAGRDSVASALLYLGYDVNTEDKDQLAEAEAALAGFDYELFADDAMKTFVSSGNIDVGLIYSGGYLAQAYTDLHDGIDLTYGYYAPENTNLWVDNVVIPKTSQNQDLANEFIKFMNEYDNALSNGYYVAFCPVIEEVALTMQKDETLAGVTDQDNFIPYHDGMKTQVYKYTNKQHYGELVDIHNRIKS